MKSVFRSVAVLAFVLMTPLLLAQNSGPAANGDFVFDAGGMAKSLTFDARVQNNGQTRGQITLIGAEDLGDQDVDGGGDANPSGMQNLTINADIDCLRIVGNRAVMAGTVTGSSVPGYAGVRTILVVEDGGEGSKKPIDRFTWGFYRGGTTLTWVATDAELTFDSGVGLSWYATDNDRNDDVPVLINGSAPSASIDCNSFSLASYDLRDIEQGAGNIQVKP